MIMISTLSLFQVALASDDCTKTEDYFYFQDDFVFFQDDFFQDDFFQDDDFQDDFFQDYCFNGDTTCKLDTAGISCIIASILWVGAGCTTLALQTRLEPFSNSPAAVNTDNAAEIQATPTTAEKVEVVTKTLSPDGILTTTTTTTITNPDGSKTVSETTEVTTS
jgi:hypothetical protein